MRRALIPHPQSVCEAVRSIDVDLARDGVDGLTLRYVMSGDIARVRLPKPAAPARTDELWRRTCFEAFAGGSGGAYREYNFAPSSQWAAYEFAAYRDGMMPADAAAPGIVTEASSDRFTLIAQIEIARATRIALSAVIEETNGRISYWALAHAPGAPDFHHAAAFALDLSELS